MTTEAIIANTKQMIDDLTDCVDKLIFKVINTPTKRMKIEYV